MNRASVLLAFFFVSVGLRSADNTHPFPKLGSYERFIAIDNACGWPMVTALPDGTLGCVIWPLPLHGYTEGAAECWVSKDGGRFWSKVGVPVPWTPARNRMNVAAGLRADGAYITMIGGWDKRLPESWRPDTDQTAAPKNYFIGANTINPVPAVSLDSGRTWRQFSEFDARQPSGQGITPYGRIAPLADGSTAVMMYKDEAAFFRSTDGGATWKKRGQLSPGRQHNETAWVQLANGDLFAVVRTEADQHMDAFRSKDDGITWTKEGPISLPMQHPADLTRLPDGRVLLSYGVRNQGDWGICVRFGDPSCTVWSAPIRLVDLEGSTDQPNRANPFRDGGYPSTVVLADGTLVTAYYSRGVPAHQRYHVGVVRWTLPTDSMKGAMP